MKINIKTIFLILLIAFGLLLCMSSDCFAGTVEFDNNIKVKISNNTLFEEINSCLYKVFFQCDYGAEELYFLAYSDKNFLIKIEEYPYNNNTEYCRLGFDFEEEPTIIKLLGNSFSYNSTTNTYSSTAGFSITTGSPELFENGVYTCFFTFDFYSNRPVSVDDLSILNFKKIAGNSGFTTPPQGILAPIVETTPLEEVIKEILGILPIVLITIVGLISLRKALQLLSAVLHRS